MVKAGVIESVLDILHEAPDRFCEVQAAMFVKLLFSNHTIQEYANSKTVRAITGKLSCSLV